MARATWEGYITLGQLGIPVYLYSATVADKLRFKQLHKGDRSPVQRMLRCQKEHKDISTDETVRAIEYRPGEYMTLTDRELDRAASSPVKTLEIKQFADTATIDPIYYEKPFYVVARTGGERAYALLREVFTKTKKMAVVQFILYGKERLGTLTVRGDLLMLQQLRYASEILSRSSLKTPALPKPSPKEMDVLQEVVERFSSPFYPEDYHDEHTDHIAELVERKAKGLKPPRREHTSPQATPPAKIIPTLEQGLNDIEGPPLTL